jgi:hypothetical protein
MMSFPRNVGYIIIIIKFEKKIIIIEEKPHFWFEG